MIRKRIKVVSAMDHQVLRYSSLLALTFGTRAPKMSRMGVLSLINAFIIMMTSGAVIDHECPSGT